VRRLAPPTTRGTSPHGRSSSRSTPPELTRRAPLPWASECAIDAPRTTRVPCRSTCPRITSSSSGLGTAHHPLGTFLKTGTRTMSERLRSARDAVGSQSWTSRPRLSRVTRKYAARPSWKCANRRAQGDTRTPPRTRHRSAGDRGSCDSYGHANDGYEGPPPQAFPSGLIVPLAG
jgi:hypothetical protein